MTPDPLDTDKTLLREDKTARYALAAGQMLGQFRVLRALGRGGMGEVYLCEHAILTTRHAVKLLPAERSASPGFVQRFHDEARVMAKLSHPGIVHVTHADEQSGRHYLVMDFVGADGTEEPFDLEDALAAAPENRLAPEIAARLCRQMAQAVGAAHRAGVVHRDLKPANVLLTSRDLAKAEARVADFGLARLLGEDWLRSRIDTSIRRSLTLGGMPTLARRREERSSSGAILGTYEYMSPEQREGREADDRSDVFALGVMLYRMVTGKRLVGRAKAASKVVAGLDPAWDELIDACLEEDPADRPQGMGPLSAALEKLEAAERQRREAARNADAVRRSQIDAETQRRAQKRAEEEQRLAAEVAKARREAERERLAAQKPLPPPVAMQKSSKVWPWALAVLAIVGGVIWAVNRQAPPSASISPQTKTQPFLSPSDLDPFAKPQFSLPVMQSTQTENLADLQSTFTNTLGMEFVPVAGLEDVLFSKWETRVQDYEPFARETGTEWPKPIEQGPTHPAVNVSWNDAYKFCEWLTQKERDSGKIGQFQRYLLPADWEWSVAVGLNEPKGGTAESKNAKIDGIYPWNRGRGTWPPPKGAGNFAASLNTDTYDQTSPVGSYEASANRLFDMGGNVWEWCEDWYNTNQQWRVLRGASWSGGDPKSLLSSCRSGIDSQHFDSNVGFRCVLSRSLR